MGTKKGLGNKKDNKSDYEICNHEYISHDDQDTRSSKRRAENCLLYLKPLTNIRKRKLFINSVKRSKFDVQNTDLNFLKKPANISVPNNTVHDDSISNESSDSSIQSASQLSSEDLFGEKAGIQQLEFDKQFLPSISKPDNLEEFLEENYSIESSSDSQESQKQISDIVKNDFTKELLARVEKSKLPRRSKGNLTFADVKSKTYKDPQCLLLGRDADIKPIKGGFGVQLENALKHIQADSLTWKYESSIFGKTNKTKSPCHEDSPRRITDIEKHNNCILLYLDNNNNKNSNLKDVILLHNNENIVFNLSEGNLIDIKTENSRNCIINNKKVFLDIYKIKLTN